MYAVRRSAALILILSTTKTNGITVTYPLVSLGLAHSTTRLRPTPINSTYLPKAFSLWNDPWHPPAVRFNLVTRPLYERILLPIRRFLGDICSHMRTVSTGCVTSYFKNLMQCSYINWLRWIPGSEMAHWKQSINHRREQQIKRPAGAIR